MLTLFVDLTPSEERIIRLVPLKSSVQESFHYQATRNIFKTKFDLNPYFEIINNHVGVQADDYSNSFVDLGSFEDISIPEQEWADYEK